MGQTLSVPATEKKTEEGSNDSKFVYAVSEMQGWRITMEDSHAIDLNLNDSGHAFFAVYDGHGGGTVANYAGQNLHKKLVSEEAYHKQDFNTALKSAFLGTDADMRQDPVFLRDTSGCTAVAALVTSDERIFVANAGDSRSVLSVKGEVKPLSFDHKPVNDSERSRIIQAGGYVEFGRVNGNLALARALGDFEYKKSPSLAPEAQIITSNPEITEHKITEEDEFLVLACDGIWDCLSSQQVVDAVRALISQGKKLPEICEVICDHCLAPDTNSGSGFGCDNMTILLVGLLHGRTEDEWYQWVADRTNKGYGYQTPKELPQLYPAGRLEAFRRRHAAYLENQARRKEVGEASAEKFPTDQGIQPPIVRFLGALAEGGSFQNNPMYGFLASKDEDDMDDEDEQPEHPHDHEHRHLDLLADSPSTSKEDMTTNLRRQLDELDGDWDDELGYPEDQELPADSPTELSSTSASAPTGTSTSYPAQQGRVFQGEAPPSPRVTTPPNGDAHLPQAQLKSDPGGDAIPAVVRAEGLLDKSEDPLTFKA